MNEHTRNDAEAVKAALLHRISEVVPELLPGARLSGGHYRAGSVAGEPGTSLAVDAACGSWIDHATGQKGGLLDLVMAARACGFKEALAWAEGRVGRAGKVLTQSGPPKPAQRPLHHFSWPELQPPTDREVTAISRLLEIGVHGLQLACQRGHLWIQAGHFVVTDSARHVRADRRLDGDPVGLANGSTTKTRTLGCAAWPVGAADIGQRPFVVLAEGISDFLAGHHLVASEGMGSQVAVCAMLGASARIHPEALRRFGGKDVLIFCDADSAGLAGGRRWRDQLDPVCRRVRLYNLAGLTRNDGHPVKDLRDFLCVNVDDWEADPEVSLPVTTFIREGART